MSTPIRVLIVEDRQEPRESLELALDGFDCEFEVARTAASALRLIRGCNFDVIFLDLRLPDGHGLKVFEQAKDECPHLGKVIVLTGLPDEQTRKQAEELGAFRYLLKLDADEVRDAFAAATSTVPRVPSSQPPRESSLISVPDKTLEPANRLLVLDDDEAWLVTIRDVLQGDFDVRTTKSPEEACEWAATESFDLAIVDMRLGTTNGLDVLKQLRQIAPGLRAIILTGFPDYVSAFETGKSHALAYVEKRELATLAEKVKELVSAKPQPVRIFLSYANDDYDAVAKLFDELTKRGFLPWMAAKKLIPGQKWEAEIEKAVAAADYFVLCHSHNSAQREGMILKEVRQAFEMMKGMHDDRMFFITARLDRSEVAPALAARQWVDLFDSDGLTKLVGALSGNRG